jgi:16S rRNA C967 or C1407 C5-methylase (RsmB/RsmF family)
VRAEDISRLAALQTELLDAAAALPTEAIVYAVCTVTEAETRGVVEAFIARSGWVPDDAGIPGAPYGPGVLLNPQEHSTDGMFVALLRPPTLPAT